MQFLAIKTNDVNFLDSHVFTSFWFRFDFETDMQNFV